MFFFKEKKKPLSEINIFMQPQHEINKHNERITSYGVGSFFLFLLPCLSLLQCRFFPRGESTPGIRTAIGILLIFFCTTCLSYSEYWATFWLWDSLVKTIRNMANTESPNPTREDMPHRGWRCRRQWLFKQWNINRGFFLSSYLPYPFQWS